MQKLEVSWHFSEFYILRKEAPTMEIWKVLEFNSMSDSSFRHFLG